MMRILFRLLGQRWCGVRGWVYLFSLALAVLVYWMLPGLSVVHSWAFEGETRFQGFTQDHQRLVITQHQQTGVLFHQLDLATGRCTTYLPLEHPDRELDYQSLMRKGGKLTLSHFDDDASKSGVMLQRADGTTRAIPFDTQHVSAEPAGSLMYGSYRFIFPAISNGILAISDDERWLIVTRRYAEVWRPLLPWIQWAQRTFLWNPSFFSDGWRYTAVIIDLRTNTEIACHLRTHSQPQYAIHPEGLGFAVIDVRHDMTTVTFPGKNTASVISWYALPPGPAYHSWEQWGIIVGSFGVPVLLAMVLSLFRYRRVAKAPVAASPHP